MDFFIISKEEIIFLLLFFNIDKSTARVIRETGNDFIQCLMTTKNGNTGYSGNVIPYSQGYSYTNGKPPVNTDKMPEAPRDFDIEVNETGTSFIWYITSLLYGVKYLKHFILKIDQTFTEKGSGDPYLDTEYLLIDLIPSISVHTTAKFTCHYTRVRKKAFVIEGTLWAVGEFTTTEDGKLKADVDKYSKTKTIRKRIDPEYLHNRKVAEQCLCDSTITIDTSIPFGVASSVGASIKITNISDDTPIEIQLLNHTKDGDFIIEKWMTKGNFEIGKQFKKRVRIGNSYYIRVIRHCLTGYIVSCGKQEADVVRTKALIVQDPVLNKNVHERKTKNGKTGRRKRKKRNMC